MRLSNIFPAAVLIVGILSILISVSCTHNAIIPSQPAVRYSTQVQPLLVASCAMKGCDGDTTGGELFPLLTYKDLINYNLVVPGNAKSSRLFQVLLGSGERLMPPNGQLANDDILLIYLWIEQGAKNN